MRKFTARGHTDIKVWWKKEERKNIERRNIEEKKGKYRKRKYRIGKHRKEKCRKEVTIVMTNRLIEIVKQF